MSHLGDLLSALVDGELSGTELDRANAHLAACEACQAEMSALRRLKLDLRTLAASCDSAGVTGRLLAMTGDDGLAVRLAARPGAAGTGDTTAGNPGYPGSYPGMGGHCAPARRRRPRRPRPAGPDTTRPGPGGLRGGPRGHSRGRYVLWGTVSLVVVGIGTAAFGMGGTGGSTAPRITPQVEVFDVEHAATTGDVPFADPSDVSAQLWEVAGRP